MKNLTGILASFLLLFLVVTVPAQTDPGTTNLTHSWLFDDGTANDYIGGANGTLKGTAEIVEGSLLLAAVGSYLELPAATISINTYEEVTVSAWYIPFVGGNPNYHMLVYFGKTNNSLGVDCIFFSPARGDNKCRAAIACGNYTSTPWVAETGVDGIEYDDGELHHMAFTIDAVNITLYIDGAPVDTNALAANNNIGLVSVDSAYLGKGGYMGDAPWTGEIPECKIYNRVLTADEVLFLFNEGVGTDVPQETTTLPREYRLMQNYPNPFNPTTNIAFELANRSKVNLKVFDLYGREIVTLLNEYRSAGQHSVQFNATNLSTGVYIYRLAADNQVLTRKMMLLK
jgi:hypothetical protein